MRGVHQKSFPILYRYFLSGKVRKSLVICEDVFYRTEAEGQSLIDDCLEIKRILVSSLKTARENH